MSAGSGAGGAVAVRPALLRRLVAQPLWDVVVIGGGATGLGCAVDAAARGHAVLVVDAQDFAKGTSSRATKLIHGGVRYLAQGRLSLVREALVERAHLLNNASHLVRALRFVVPAYRMRDKPMLAAGLGLYDVLAGRRGIAPSRVLDREETLVALSNARTAGLRGAIAYWDAQFDDARLALALARTVLDLGGLALNHCPATGLVVEDGRVRGVNLRDAETGAEYSVRARVVINAAGVWADSVRRMAEGGARASLRPSQGVHLVVGREFLPGTDALLVPQTDDGRVLFMIPWQGRVLLGTTDTAREDLPFEPHPQPGEVDFILETAARYLERAPKRSDILSVFVGLRPLIDSGNAAFTGQLSREHVIEVSPRGLVSVLGGKWTTYRRMAEDAIDAAQAAAGLPARRVATTGLRLHGAPARAGAGLERDVYGTDREKVDALPGAGRKVIEGLAMTEAEVRYAVRAEFARSVEDVLARRNRALFVDAALAERAAPAVAAILAEELGRPSGWIATEVADFGTLARGYRC